MVWLKKFLWLEYNWKKKLAEGLFFGCLKASIFVVNSEISFSIFFSWKGWFLPSKLLSLSKGRPHVRKIDRIPHIFTLKPCNVHVYSSNNSVLLCLKDSIDWMWTWSLHWSWKFESDNKDGRGGAKVSFETLNRPNWQPPSFPRWNLCWLISNVGQEAARLNNGHN